MDSFPQETIRTKKTMNKRLDMYLCYTIKNSCKSVKNLYDNSHFKEHLTLEGEIEFEKKALDLFAYQSAHNPVYRAYVQALSRTKQSINSSLSIPFLPISFFKTHTIRTGDFKPATCFESSGTSGERPSKHCIPSIQQYLENATANFSEFYGDPSRFCVLALLPSYLERGNSSLVAMADHFIQLSSNPASGFFLNDFQDLANQLKINESIGASTLLLGVTYALLDFAEQYPLSLQQTIVMETGGMKGRRKEVTRDELHAELIKAWGLTSVHAEYGMTELQSQAYSMGRGIFYPPATLRVILRALDDPFDTWDWRMHPGRAGAINLIDLANHATQTFIATDDIGRFTGDGGFEITGRMDNCDIRGCSLLVV